MTVHIAALVLVAVVGVAAGRKTLTRRLVV
jgi:hypothetical protein